MKRRTKLLLGASALVVVAAGAFAVRSANGESAGEGPASVTVARGDVVDRALAVGTIEPETEVAVKSKVSGVVRRLFAEEGDRVEAGDPLIEIRPDPTPLELVDARRDLQMREAERDNARRERDRQKALADRQLTAAQDLERAEQELEQAELRLRSARERLQLLERGSVPGAGGVESVVRAPIGGFVLEQSVEVGDPVTPLSTYQEGTVLMTMADMGRLVFRGTVDEIDVGRLREGMPVEVRIGALPEAAVRGTVARIGLKAQKEESATTFPVEIEIAETGGATLRAGLSANAEIVIRRAENVLTVPERVVTFEDGGAWVRVLRADGTGERRVVRTGLSDALSVEVVEGLEEGETVLEKPAKTIE